MILVEEGESGTKKRSESLPALLWHKSDEGIKIRLISGGGNFNL